MQEKRKKMWKYLLAAVFVLVSGLLYLSRISDSRKQHEWQEQAFEGDFLSTAEQAEKEKDHTDKVLMPEEKTAVQPVAELRVHVCGAVKLPGVYVLQQGERLVDAVEAAGGFLQEAAEDYCNLAALLRDGEQIYIPTVTEVQTGGFDRKTAQEPELSKSSDSSKVNINTATVNQLTALSGIGLAKAKAIVEYRESHGAFAKCEDLMKVAGIKEAVYRKISEEIEVGH